MPDLAMKQQREVAWKMQAMILANPGYSDKLLSCLIEDVTYTRYEL